MPRPLSEQVVVISVRAVPLHAPYTAGKFAVRAFYGCLRMELADEGAPIAVTTILPASIDTPFFNMPAASWVRW